MKAILIVLILICMEAACVTAGNKTGIIESDVEGGRLCLWCGIAKLWYYKIGDQRGGTTGENQAAYADKTWLGRQFMEAHPGDWCAFVYKINEENVITIDDSTMIEIALADGSAVWSEEILAMNGPNETRIWAASASICPSMETTGGDGSTGGVASLRIVGVVLAGARDYPLGAWVQGAIRSRRSLSPAARCPHLSRAISLSVSASPSRDCRAFPPPHKTIRPE